MGCASKRRMEVRPEAKWDYIVSIASIWYGPARPVTDTQSVDSE